MSKQIRVDDDFVKYLDKFAGDLEKELSFRPSKVKITKSLAQILNNMEIRNGKRKPKKRKWLFEIKTGNTT